MSKQGNKIVEYALKQVGKNYASFGLNDEWCARFIWKVAEACGFLNKYYSQTDGAGTQPRLSVPAGYGKFFLADGSYKPQKGDCVLYRYSSDDNYNDIYHSDHIGFVTSSNNSNEFTSVEGNTNGSGYYDTHVNTFTRRINQPSVHGFYVPNFNLNDDNEKENCMEIKKGDNNNFVLAYKSLLTTAKNLGIINQKVDNTSSFGDGTYKATIEVQKKYDLDVDGIAGINTITALRDGIIDKFTKLDRNAILDEAINVINKLKV